jgi:hypothetical protein
VGPTKEGRVSRGRLKSKWKQLGENVFERKLSNKAQEAGAERDEGGCLWQLAVGEKKKKKEKKKLKLGKKKEEEKNKKEKIKKKGKKKKQERSS